jgi:hypothetical protein
LNCSLESDFFGIPLAHGFKYLVKHIRSFTCDYGGARGTVRCTPVVYSDQEWFVQGVQRVDESWWYKPWNYQTCGAGTCPQPWTILNVNSHPNYGADAKSADWLGLWNVAYTYSSSGPNWKQTGSIESEHHQCMMLFAQDIVEPDGTKGARPLDFLVAGEKHDPLGPFW